MPRRTTPQKFRRRLIAIAASAALAPASAWALDLANSPPGTVEPYVAPNVILSLDDSGSMRGKDMINNTKTRLQVLQEAIEEVFNDKSLLPDGKIRLAWQSFGLHPAKSSVDGWSRSDCVSVSGLTLESLSSSVASKSDIANSMRILDSTHRKNLIDYAKALKACTNTPTHWLVKQADKYMRADYTKMALGQTNQPKNLPMPAMTTSHWDVVEITIFF